MTKENRHKKMPLTKKHQPFRRRILTDDEIKAFAGHMRKFMGPTFAALSDKYAISLEDTLRFQPVAARLAGARTARGMTLKEAAASLKVPKYQLDYIENVSIRNISSKIASRYIEFLGLTRWFGKWKKANAEFAQRMGFTENVTDVQKEKKKRGRAHYPSAEGGRLRLRKGKGKISLNRR